MLRACPLRYDQLETPHQADGVTHPAGAAERDPAADRPRDRGRVKVSPSPARGRSERNARAGHVGDEILGRMRLDVARDLAARLDLDLAVADRAGDAAGRADQQALAHDEV